MSLEKKSDRAAGKVSLLEYLLLATGLALAVVAWEHGLYAFIAPDYGSNLAAVLLQVSVEFAVALPLAVLALIAGLRLARSLGLGIESASGVLGSAATVSILLVALLAPAAGPRALGVQRLEEALESWNSTQKSSLDSPDPEDSLYVLCSFNSARRWREASRLTGFSGIAKLVGFGFPDVLMDQVILFPMALILLCLHRRRSGGRPARAFARAGRLLLRPVPLGVTAAAAVAATFGICHALRMPETRAIAIVPDRIYEVSAIHVNMTLNRFGDHDAGAFMYVLDQNIPNVRAEEGAPLPGRVSNGLRKDFIQPLVIRANLGESVEIHFTNRLTDGPASFHIHGLPHSAESAGSATGLNPDTNAAPGETVIYRFTVPAESNAEHSYYIHDNGASRQRIAHGLFGALAVEPAGSDHLDPETGISLYAPDPVTAAPGRGSNWEAIIDVPDPDPANPIRQPDFREFVILYHEVGDETFTNILDAEGKDLPQFDDVAGVYRPASRALNYRSEPFRNRLLLTGTEFKGLGYGSYAHGDPATPIPRSYLGEPTKTRLMHGGSEVFHVHHLHGGADRWPRSPRAEDPLAAGKDFRFATTPPLQKKPDVGVHSTRIDAQAIGPGVSYNLEHECGAGGCQQVAGDFLYHCHIGHHYVAGMWSFWRVLDTLQADLAPLPSGPVPKPAVEAFKLAGLLVDGKTLKLASDPTFNPLTDRSLTEFIETQFPPPGARIDRFDATVWDWQRQETASGPRYFGEPEDETVWANYESPDPGVRPEILFNPDNGRYTWPLFRPHLGQRPPFSGNGHTGAPWLGERGVAAHPDGLIPNNDVLASQGHVPNPGQTIRQYPITAIEVPIPVTRDESDPDGRIFVLSEDKEAVRGGAKPAQPLAIRSNVGDGIDILLTSELTDRPIDDFFSKVNMHIHFVQFDPQASDGVITGFSYEQSVRPYATEGRVLELAAAAGATTIHVTHVDRLRPGVWIGIGLGEGILTGVAGIDPRQRGIAPATEIRRIASLDAAASTITLEQPLAFTHAAGQAVGVEFVRYAWYSDIDTGTVFWHDHVNFKNWDHGLFGTHIIEPRGSSYHDPATGEEVRSGTVVDIHVDTTTPGTLDPEDPFSGSAGYEIHGSFREFMLFLHGRSPVNGGEFSGGTINLRAEPFDLRSGDPAFLFSSVTHGDPITPLPRAYLGDPFVIRGMGLVERVGGIRVTGHRFRLERYYGEGDLRDTTHLGISERFDPGFIAGGPAGSGYPGDYLYYSTIARQFESGAWGILRVHDTLQGSLQPLPDQPQPPAGAGFPEQTVTGGPPAPAPGPGTPCPPGAPSRSYDVRIARANIIYNDGLECLNGGQSPRIRDSNGIAFLLKNGSGGGGRPDVREPLVLRANQGDCIEINLTNDLPTTASISAGELRFDPQGSYGAAVGFNLDSTVASGATRTYRFHADANVGTTMALNLADPTTGARGAYAAIIIEPPGSTYTRPDSLEPAPSGVAADIHTPDGRIREFVTLIHDEDPEIGQTFMPYPDRVQKFTGINYSAEPLKERDFENNPSQAFSSALHGDPRLVFTADIGDPVVFRVGQPWGEQVHVFSIHGHRWLQEPYLPLSEELAADLLAPGVAFDAYIVGGAGGAGPDGARGDHLFLDHRQPFLEAGLWGLFRVRDPASPPGILPCSGAPPAEDPGPPPPPDQEPPPPPPPPAEEPPPPGVLPVELASLKGVPVPEPQNLGTFVASRADVIALGKAFYWEMQVGSDGIQACASCHFFAGADTRAVDQLSPGLLGGDTNFEVGPPNHALTPADFPFHRLSNIKDAASVVLFDSNDVASSRGVFNTSFLDIKPLDPTAAELVTVVPDPDGFRIGAMNSRKVEPRNTPSVINAVFNVESFWDGRARFFFNGVNPHGLRDQNARILFKQPDGTVTKEQIALDRSSLGSQAVGPVLSHFEMSAAQRSFPKVGKKILPRVPLAKQKVHPEDSVLAAYSKHPAPGLKHPITGMPIKYADMIRAAFRPELWDSNVLVEIDPAEVGGLRFAGSGLPANTDQFTMMEANFSLFWGIAVMMYERTLVSDDSPFDRFASGDAGALNEREKIGMAVFANEGRCVNCHSGPLFTDTTVNVRIDQPIEQNLDPEGVIERMPMADFNEALYDGGFYNIGVRPTANDRGRGGLDPNGDPLSFSRFAVQNGQNHPLLGAPVVLDPPIGPLERVAVDGAFKTPGLRNANLTGPYFHNGGQGTLDQVVQFYTRGGDFAAANIDNLDPDIQPILELMDRPDLQAALAAFLRSLTDASVRCESGRFDHPQLFIPDGYVTDPVTGLPVDADGDGRADERFTEIPEVGAGGRGCGRITIINRDQFGAPVSGAVWGIALNSKNPLAGDLLPTFYQIASGIDPNSVPTCEIDKSGTGCRHEGIIAGGYMASQISIPPQYLPNPACAAIAAEVPMGGEVEVACENILLKNWVTGGAFVNRPEGRWHIGITAGDFVHPLQGSRIGGEVAISLNDGPESHFRVIGFDLLAENIAGFTAVGDSGQITGVITDNGSARKLIPDTILISGAVSIDNGAGGPAKISGGNFTVHIKITRSRGKGGELAIEGIGLQLPGDCNQDGTLDITDGLCLFGALFLGDPELFPCGDGTPQDPGNVALLDWQADLEIDISDGIALLQYIFAGGPPHPMAALSEEGAGCIPLIGCPNRDPCGSITAQ